MKKWLIGLLVLIFIFFVFTSFILGKNSRIVNEAQCRETCAKEGYDYYGDCAEDSLNLEAKRVAACSACKGCGCYCLSPEST